jgi:hypothetical protein
MLANLIEISYSVFFEEKGVRKEKGAVPFFQRWCEIPDALDAPVGLPWVASRHLAVDSGDKAIYSP